MAVVVGDPVMGMQRLFVDLLARDGYGDMRVQVLTIRWVQKEVFREACLVKKCLEKVV